MPVTDRFRSQCRLLRIASLVVFTGLALLFALGLVGPPMWAPRAPGDAGTRFALAVVRFLPGLGYLWALWDNRKQTWHDKVVSTVVVRA